MHFIVIIYHRRKKMKIICAKDQLHYAVQVVQKAVATKAPSPILTGIYLSANNGKIELQATDYEIGIKCVINAEIIEPGSIVLSGRYLQDIVRRLPGEQVQIETNQEDHTIKIKSNQAQFNLLSLPAEEFPVLKILSPDNKFTIKDNILRELIKKTTFACATDEARPIFTGALLEANENSLRMVATNTHRLALKKENLDFDKTVRMIIPAKILNELARQLTSEIPIDVNIYFHRNQVAFEFEEVYIISRIIEGQFPDYNKVIPANFATSITVNTLEFLDAVNLVSLLARDAEYNVIKFSFREDSITITSNNPDVGKATETIPSHTEGNGLEIAFNAKYIHDIVKNIDSKEMMIYLNTPLSPVCIKQVDDNNYTYIVTPVRTN